MKNLIAASILVFLALIGANSFANQHCDINIKNRKFTSGSLKRISGEKCKFKLEANKKHKLTFCNLDKIPAEVESHDLKIEKIIKGESNAQIRIKELKKGKTYEFEEEFGHYECEFEAI